MARENCPSSVATKMAGNNVIWSAVTFHQEHSREILKEVFV